MRTKELIADFSGGLTVTRTDPLFQYDHGMVLRIKGTEITGACTVHFASAPSDEGSYQIIGHIDSGDLVVDIPDNLLGDGATNIYAYVYYSDGDSGYTVYRSWTPIILRARPDNYQPTDAEWASFDQALQAVNEAAAAVQEAEQAIEECILRCEMIPITGGYRLEITDKNGTHTCNVLNGLPGEKGEKGDTGPAGKGIASLEYTGQQGLTKYYTLTYTDGTTMVFGVTDGADGNDGMSPQVSITPITGGHQLAITDEYGVHIANIMDGTDGQDGQDGTDGYSPTVTITQISGGHRITITDKTGSHTCDVMNGQDGQDGSDGQDGYSPTASVSKSGTTTTITITDQHGTTTANVNDGDDYVLTNQDKQDIADIVLSELPTWTGGAY